jgi:ubiquinone biosynthesis protein COQ9
MPFDDFSASKMHSERQKVVRAFLRMVSSHGLSLLTVRDVAQEAKISTADFYLMFDTLDDVVQAYGRMLDHQLCENFSQLDYTASVRDRLFDILMERFDLMNGDRQAVLSLMKSMRFDPKYVLCHCPHVMMSLARMCELAGLSTQGGKGLLRVTGLLGVYLWALRVFMTDESKDLAKTMAALDKALGQADRFAANFQL